MQSITVTQILDTGDNQQQRYGPISFICLPSPAPFPAFYLTYSRFEVADSLHIQFSFLNSDDPPLLLRRVIPSHTNAELYELVGFQLELFALCSSAAERLYRVPFCVLWIYFLMLVWWRWQQKHVLKYAGRRMLMCLFERVWLVFLPAPFFSPPLNILNTGNSGDPNCS